MSTPKARKPRLGRGLSSLMSHPVTVPLSNSQGGVKLPDIGPGSDGSVGGLAKPQTDSSSSSQGSATGEVFVAGESEGSVVSEGAGGDALVYLPVGAIEPNPHQPRRRFDPEALRQLSASIRAEGVMQPVIVRPVGDGYQLVAGERRWRAACEAELSSIPAIIRQLSDQQVAEWAIIENLQREDLNPIERAHAFHDLIQTHRLSHEQVAERIGVDRSTISNTLRLLTLHEDIQAWVVDGLLSMGHARALAGVLDTEVQRALARQTIEREWSVRKVEKAARELSDSRSEGAVKRGKRNGVSSHLTDIEQQIARALGTKVRIQRGRRKGTGTLCIDFYSVEQFDTLLSRLAIVLED